MAFVSPFAVAYRANTKLHMHAAPIQDCTSTTYRYVICASTHTEKILILLLPGGKRSVANKARQGLCIYIVYGHSFDFTNLVAHHKQYSANTSGLFVLLLYKQRLSSFKCIFYKCSLANHAKGGHYIVL